MSSDDKNPQEEEDLPRIILYCHLFKDMDKGIIQTVKVKLGPKDKRVLDFKSQLMKFLNQIIFSSNNHKILNLFSSQRIKKQNAIDLKSNIINQEKNNKESWQSNETKETTTKGSIESKNSIFSHSPPKEDEEDNKKNNNHKINLFISNNNYNNNNFVTIQNLKSKQNDSEKEDDITPFEMIDPEKDIPIDNNKIKEDKNLYGHMQRRLKKILLKGRLPRFDLR